MSNNSSIRRLKSYTEAPSLRIERLRLRVVYRAVRLIDGSPDRSTTATRRGRLTRRAGRHSTRPFEIVEKSRRELPADEVLTLVRADRIRSENRGCVVVESGSGISKKGVGTIF